MTQEQFKTKTHEAFRTLFPVEYVGYCEVSDELITDLYSGKELTFENESRNHNADFQFQVGDALGVVSTIIPVVELCKVTVELFNNVQKAKVQKQESELQAVELSKTLKSILSPHMTDDKVVSVANELAQLFSEGK